MVQGQLIVITGPSGVGKGTLVNLLLDRHPEIKLSISATTRSPRSGEIDGQDYYFVSMEKFQAMIAAEELLEWAEYAGNYYGTPRHPIDTSLAAGKTILLEIEVVGAQAVKTMFPEALRIFILPPSMEELAQRLVGRGKDTPEVIQRRLERATEEIALSSQFEHQLVNRDLQQTLTAIEDLIIST
ncbi:MAG: guanylate kinase [Synechococcaceae cyanobacterium RL_1_2]|nr:guanylate kinase [Synechococcaceae cyanobacterium RL_1_2]